MMWLVKDSINTVSLGIINSNITDFSSLSVEAWKNDENDKTIIAATFVEKQCRLNRIVFIIDTTGMDGEYNFCLLAGNEIVGRGIMSINSVSQYTELGNGAVVTD